MSFCIGLVGGSEVCLLLLNVVLVACVIDADTHDSTDHLGRST